MTTGSALSRLLIPSLGVAVALGSTSMGFAASMPGNASPSRIGTVSYDRKAEALVIPVAGTAPQVTVRRLAPRQYVADFPKSELAIDQLQGQQLKSPMLAGWSLDELPDGRTVRLRLTMNQDVKPTIQVTRQQGRMLIGFQSGLARTPVSNSAFPVAAPVHRASPAARFAVGKQVGYQGAKPTTWAGAAPAVKAAAPVATSRVKAPAPIARTAAPKIATLGVPHVDTKRRMVVVPVAAGTLPVTELKIVRLNQRWAYVDVPGAVPAFSGVRYENRKDPLLDRWVMSKRPKGHVTRVSFALGGEADLAIQASGKEILVAVRPKTMMLGSAPAPVKPAPKVAAAPAKPAAKPAAVAVKPALKPAATQVSRPYFDESRYGLVVPYEGKVPLYRFARQDDKGVVLELKGDLVKAGNLLQNFRRHPLMASWSLERRRHNGTVRIGLNFSRPSELIVAADPNKRQLILIPQPAHQDEPLAAKKVETALAAIERDTDSHHLYIPFSGQAPAYTVEQVSPTFAYISFGGTRLEGRGIHFFSPDHHPTLNYGLLSAGEAGGARLALALTQPGGATVYEDRANARLVVVVGGGAQAKAAGRSAPRMPGPWVGQARPASPAPALPGIELSRRAS